MEGEYAGVGHPDWWRPGSGQAGRLNAGAINQVSQDLTKALHKSALKKTIEI
jgi:hypothetical protein